MNAPSTPDSPSGQRRAGGATRPHNPEGDNQGVLSSLPRTRPQRPSARRAAARRTAALRAERTAATRSTETTEAPTEPAAIGPAKPARAPDKPAASGSAKPTTKPRSKPTANARPGRTGKTRPKPAEPPVPPQGFEAEEAIEPGRSVQPPSGPELAVSVAELVGELAQASLATGGRLLSDVLKRLSGG